MSGFEVEKRKKSTITLKEQNFVNNIEEE